MKGCMALWALLFCVAICGNAQTSSGDAKAPSVPSKAQDPLHRESPRGSVYYFLEACHARNYEEAWHYIDLRNASQQVRSKDGPHLAQQLAQILDRDARFDVASLSASADGDTADGLAPKRERVDSFQLNGKEVRLELERVTLRSGSSVWLFSSGCIELIPQLALLVSDSPIERYLPPLLVEWKLLDTSLWRWIALALLAAVLAPLSSLLSYPATYVTETIAKRLAPKMDRNIIQAFVGPLRLLVCIAVFRAGIEWTAPSALLRLYLERVMTLVFCMTIAWICMVITDILMRHLRAALESKHPSFSYSALPLASRFLKITILILTITAVLSGWGYHTTTILAGLGVGGLAIALAAQKTIENLFGGVAVITDRPVAVGDFCRFGDLVGTVEDVGLRSTRIRTLGRTLVSVPNAEFSTMTLENFSRRDKMWFHITLNLKRDTQPSQVRSLLQSITQLLEKHAKVETGALPVRFVGVGTYSLDVEVFAYVLTPDYDEFLQIQQELLLRILDAVQSAGTALAVPTQAYFSLGTTAPAPGRLPEAQATMPVTR